MDNQFTTETTREDDMDRMSNDDTAAKIDQAVGGISCNIDTNTATAREWVANVRYQLDELRLTEDDAQAIMKQFGLHWNTMKADAAREREDDMKSEETRRVCEGCRRQVTSRNHTLIVVTDPSGHGWMLCGYCRAALVGA